MTDKKQITESQRKQLQVLLIIVIAGAVVIAVGVIVLNTLISQMPLDENVELWNAAFWDGAKIYLVGVVMVAVLAGVYAYKKYPIPPEQEITQ